MQPARLDRQLAGQRTVVEIAHPRELLCLGLLAGPDVLPLQRGRRRLRCFGGLGQPADRLFEALSAEQKPVLPILPVPLDAAYQESCVGAHPVQISVQRVRQGGAGSLRVIAVAKENPVEPREGWRNDIGVGVAMEDGNQRLVVLNGVLHLEQADIRRA